MASCVTFKKSLAVSLTLHLILLYCSKPNIDTHRPTSSNSPVTVFLRQQPSPQASPIRTTELKQSNTKIQAHNSKPSTDKARQTENQSRTLAIAAGEKEPLAAEISAIRQSASGPANEIVMNDELFKNEVRPTAASRIDRFKLRQQAALAAKETSLPNPNPAPNKETPLARELAKAVKPSCFNAYSHTGLLAIPLLLRDAVSDSGCTWSR